MATPSLRLVYSAQNPETAKSSEEQSFVHEEKIITASDSESKRSLVNIDEIYREQPLIPSPFGRALFILAEIIKKTDTAIEMYSTDALGADHLMQYVQSRLPELFSCRSIGEGYGISINAMIGVYENLEGNPFELNQIERIKQVLSKLRSEPLIDAEDAAILIELLEDAGLKVEPPAFDELVEMLNE